VNERFAETVLPLIEPDDIVWVQDYHLVPLGQELRRRGCANRLGFFLHIPWPPRRLLNTLPEAETLVQTMFAYDLIGFHTQEWLQAFIDFVVNDLGAVEEEGGVLRLGDRRVRAIACPIGIEAREFAEMARGPVAQATCVQMKESANERAMIVGVDRLDYSKGLEERFLGYERFLHDHPEVHKRLFLLQIAPPSRGSVETYQKIRTSLEGLSGRINGAFADLDWVPLRYVNHVLAGVYRSAQIGLVTPMRDGMNLVAKEYVAAQDPENPGVLILSRFAGAAEQLADALLVNPHSAEELADALLRALHMKLDERKRRWRAMMDVVEREDVLWWRQSFTDALLEAAPEAAIA
jgi:trehalose 6-phosphate synthase